jgi:hypothetical protein
LSLAAVLKTSLAKDCNLLDNISWLSIWIWRWEHITIVQEHLLYSFDSAFMNSKCESSTNINSEVINVPNPSWILSQIASLPLSVSLVVRGDDDDLLAKVSKTNGELIYHDAETADCGPSADFGGAEHDWAQFVGIVH